MSESLRSEPERTRKAVVVCVGNLLLGDDGLGVHIARKLEEGKLPDGVEALDAGTSAFYARSILDEATHLLFVDAMARGGAPGSVYTLGAEEILNLPCGKFSVHQISIADTVAAMRLRRIADSEPLPGMALVGVEPVRLDPGVELSEAVRGIVPEVIRRVSEILAGWGFGGGSSP